jgi:ABC-type nickel/cobalt efflux system permease component RcnA
MTTTEIVLIVVGVLVVAGLAWFLWRQQRTKTLRQRFGPEYEHALHEYGSQPKAEEALEKRQRRREKLNIHDIPLHDREQFSARWHEVQTRFVDDPAGSISEADALVTEVMKARGYPVSEFERRAEDLSVDHPHVVRNYRSAHAIALKHDRGQASTEDLRQALVFYRDLFDELLEAHATGPRGHR